jgi:NitT/TauT family transport system substrate-binding protein
VVLVAALVAVLPAGLFARGQENADGLETVRIGVMTDSIIDYAVQVGNAEGIWAKHGLRIESANFAMGINTIDAVSTGNMDIAYGADFAVLNRFGGSQANPLRVFVAVGESRPDSWNLYVQGDDIQSAKDLAGKPVVTQLGTVVEYWLARILALNNVDTKTVTFLPVESPMEGVALIQSGQASAMWASTTAGQRLAAINGVHTISDLAPTGAPTLSFLLATEEFLTTRQAATVKLLQAYQEIFDFFKNNTQRAAELINKSSGTPVQQIANNLKDAIIYIDFTQKNYSDAESLYSWMLTNGVIKIPYSLRDVIRTDALKTAFPGRGDFN